jgi:predicted acetyltransferase
MGNIKQIPLDDFDAYLDIIVDAYPGMKIDSEEKKKKARANMLRRQEDPRVSDWGCYDNSKMIGGIRLFDFTMNFRQTKVLTGGGGMLGVSLLHKKEHVAHDLMKHFIQYFRDKKAPFAILWPFRPDFYKKMGFGYGSRMYQYRIKPEYLPPCDERKKVRFLNRDDVPALKSCYNSVVEQTHGMIEETDLGWQIIYDLGQPIRYAGYFSEGALDGYIVFDSEPGVGGFLRNNIKLIRCIHRTPAALAGLLGFLHSQADQFDFITYNTHEDNLFYLLKDIRKSDNLLAPVFHESHSCGIGLMYKVIDIPALFGNEAISFGDQSCRIKFAIADAFTPENDGQLMVEFHDGKAQMIEGGAVDATVYMDVSDFSSLVMGSITFEELLRYGLAQISNEEFAATVNALFATGSRPVCYTMF